MMGGHRAFHCWSQMQGHEGGPRGRKARPIMMVRTANVPFKGISKNGVMQGKDRRYIPHTLKGRVSELSVGP
jgi:hypothetical protein